MELRSLVTLSQPPLSIPIEFAVSALSGVSRTGVRVRIMERGITKTHKGYKLAYHHADYIQSHLVTITAIEEERRETTLGRRAPADG